jgi:Uma2 family endonuclease
MGRAIEDTQVWQLSVEQYHQMVRSGILTEDDPVELLQGRLITKMSKNPPHTLSNELLREALEPLLPSGWCLNVQQPITTSDSEPEPDITVFRGTRRDYADRHPGPSDIGFVVEVADSTLKNDQGLKLEIYAYGPIKEYWVVNLVQRQVEVYSGPQGTTYQKQAIYDETMAVPVSLDGQVVGSIEVGGFLP